MKPGKLDLPTIWRGCDWGPVTLKWKDANGEAIDLRAWTPLAQSLNVNLHPIKVGNGIHGETNLSLTSVQTLHLKLGVEKWDWIWQSNNGSYRFPPFLSGTIAIKEPVVRLPGDIPDLPSEDFPPEFVEEPPLVELPS
jgi:hypothetical protein